jgi:hypothetical protein
MKHFPAIHQSVAFTMAIVALQLHGRGGDKDSIVALWAGISTCI